MKKLRMIAACVLAVLVAIVVLQNTEAVETHLLFATVTLPRAVLLLTTALVGFALGVLTSLVWMRSQEKKTGLDQSG
jgi:uncharacterized integral membrane protein